MAQTEGQDVTASQQRILEAARNLFFREGFAGVSTDRLAREASVSKSTIYKYFGDMMGVLKAVTEAEADHFEIDMTRPPKTRAEFLKILTRFGAELIRTITRPEKIQFDRLIFEQSRGNPGLAALYYDSIIARTQSHLAELIRYGQKQAFIDHPSSPKVLADHLLSMWQGLAATQARLGLIDRPIPDAQAWSKRCVNALF